jgi:aryl-alcohol dehydrogenase-like predicted oxidoreductase
VVILCNSAEGDYWVTPGLSYSPVFVSLFREEFLSMKYRLLGRTGLEVGEIGYGLWGMGGWSGSNDEESAKSLQLALDMGCNFFDSAWAYGDGKSDQLLGHLVRQNPGRVIYTASKVPPKNLKWPGTSEDPATDAYPAEHVNEYAHRIRDALGVKTIDLLQFHVWDDSWAEDRSWAGAISDLKAAGVIRFFGISLNRWEPENGIAAIKTGHVDTVQVIYNIFDQAPEDQLFPICRELNIGVIARVPLDEGSLGGGLTHETTFPSDDWRSGYFGLENLSPTVDRVERLKSETPPGLSLPEMALRFILTNPDVSTAIVGMRRPEYVKANIAASDGHPLETGLINRLRAHRWDRKVEPWAN